MNTQQLPLFSRPEPRKARKEYRPNGQEVPAHLPRLEEGAETMAALVLEWFSNQRVHTTWGDKPVYQPMTPTDCAEATAFPLTTVRPRICQLAKRTSGPRLEHCKWIKRRPTGRSSEGWYRYKEGV